MLNHVVHKAHSMCEGTCIRLFNIYYITVLQKTDCKKAIYHVISYFGDHFCCCV